MELAKEIETQTNDFQEFLVCNLVGSSKNITFYKHKKILQFS